MIETREVKNGYVVSAKRDIVQSGVVESIIESEY